MVLHASLYLFVLLRTQIIVQLNHRLLQVCDLLLGETRLHVCASGQRVVHGGPGDCVHEGEAHLPFYESLPEVDVCQKKAVSVEASRAAHQHLPRHTAG